MMSFRDFATFRISSFVSLLICLVAAHALPAAEDHALPATEDAVFRDKVLPVLAKHCLDCHGAEEPEANLNLTTREALLVGARSGYIITPGKASASLVSQLLVKGSKPHMPPEGQLSDEEIEVVTSWIDSLENVPLPPRPSLAKGLDHWAFQSPKHEPLPTVKSAALTENAIDSFVLARLEDSQLSLSAPAQREVLLRRAAIDLIGLPPSPEEVQAFAADSSPDAYERKLDQYLASPAYGERWGRHWLDLARYADSGGFHDDLDRPHAWRYRDYVIRSLNADKSYAEFIREQLAGDELAPANPQALAATAFCRNGPTNDDNMGNNAFDREKYRLDLLDDVISTTSAVYLGLTVGCARCHDHKFDPIPQTDYYQLLAVFNNITRKDVPFGESGEPELAGKWTKGQAGIMAITDVGRQPRETFVLYRGDLNNKGPKVEANVPRLFQSAANFKPAALEKSSGQRLALANWIAAEENPLSWRVMANRLWQHHFSRGIVSTPSNFGLTGAPPSHPELLDWLATELSARGSWKKLHRLMMTSATYRQSSQGSKSAESVDPENLLLWRMNKRRLEAEAIRDSVLQVAGTLNHRVGGPGVKPRIPTELLEASQRNKWPVVKTEGPEHWRRSVYIYVKRQMAFPLLELFDIPSTAHTCDCRQDSTIPTQALVLMNDQFTADQAARFAKRVQVEVGPDARESARRALWLALGREPTPSRCSEAEEFLRAQAEFHQSAKKPADESATLALVDLCHVLLNSNEFLYVD
ncbi:PSD1 and planctomycete cytochrome C domain-containing protein [Anatilimnocola aggregata]|nr:PSD1 and planctomycete cytochrome C domain-containing protein [Anatilimnocola aggregata]